MGGGERKRENCIIVSHIKINATGYKSQDVWKKEKHRLLCECVVIAMNYMQPI